MNSPRVMAAGLLFLSGAAALSHQILWTRRLVDVLGAGPGTFARVVGVFFAALALGAAWAARHPVEPRRAWRRVAIAESAVAVLVLPVLGSVVLGDWLRPILGGAILGWLLPLLVVAGPAFAMGVVFAAVVTAISAQGGQTLRLYIANTAGGVVGLGGVTLWVLPSMGLDAACLAVASVNLLVALGAAQLHAMGNRLVADVGPLPPAGDFISPPEGRRPTSMTNPSCTLPAAQWVRRRDVLAFASGAWVLGLEVVLQQHFAQVTINSQFSGATVLGSVLVSLVGGSVLAAVRAPSGPAARRWIGWILGVAAFAAVLEPWLLAVLRPGLESVPYQLDPFAYYLRVAGLALALVVPASLTMGAVFPVLMKEQASTPRPGVTVARLLAINGVGGWLGAEAMSLVLLPGLGLWLPMALWALLALGMALLAFGGGRRSLVCIGLAAALVMVIGVATVGLPQVTPVKDSRTVATRVGREGVVAVMRRSEDDWWITFNNSYTLGGSRAQANQERQAHLPLLLHGHARSVGVLGLATGSTVGGAVLHPDVERIVAAELSPLVARFASEHFGLFNRQALLDPRVQVVVEDARLMVRDRPAAFDVVIGDLFLPWRTGEGRLFSREHFESVRRSLRPGGVYCQWLPLFQLTRPQVDVILRTLQQEFPRVILLRGDFYADLPILGLLAFEDGRDASAIDWASVESACQRLREGPHGRVSDGLVRHAEGVLMMVVGDAPPIEHGPVNTLGNGWLEWDAGRNIVGLRQPWFIGVPAAEMLRQSHRELLPRLPERWRKAHDAGQFYLTLEVAERSRANVVGSLKAQVADRLPSAVRMDPAIDWRLWPSSVKPSAGGGNPVGATD